LNKKGMPWPFLGGGTRAWGNLKIYYFLLCCFFKRPSFSKRPSIASSRMALVGFFLSTARCFSFTIRSGLRRVVKLSRGISFLTLTRKIINELIHYVKNFLLDSINDLMYYCNH